MRNILIIRSHNPQDSTETIGNNLKLIQELSNCNINFYLVSDCPLLLDYFKKQEWKYVKLSLPKSNFSQKIKLLYNVKKLRKFFKIDTIICFSLPEKILITPWAKRNKIKVIWLEQNYIDKIKLKTLEKLSYKKWSNYSLLISDSNSIKEELVDFGIKKNRIIPIHQGIRPEDYPETKNKRFINKGIFTIGTISQLKEEKGLSILVSAVQNLWNIIPNLYLIIVGDGPLKENLLWVTQKAGIDSRTRIIGPRQDAYKWVESFDLFVLPNTKKEPFNKYILESIYYKKPVIASNIGASSEYIIDNETGMLFKPGVTEELENKIIQLYSNPELVKKITSGAYQRLMDKYTLQETAKKYVEILNE